MTRMCGRMPSLALIVALLALPASPASADAFDVRTGHAPKDVVIPAVIPVVYGFVSSGANDATLVLRITTLLTNAWFDAIAPYHPTAVGVHSRLGRRPAGEASDQNRNIAMLHASYHVLNSLLPAHRSVWRAMLRDVGLDPDDARVSRSSPVGIGNLAGRGVVQARERDGMNQLGDEGGARHHLRPYADYTGYAPVNGAYELVDPSRWQPDVVTAGNGLFRVQQFVTPQMRLTRPYSYANPAQFVVQPPSSSDHHNAAAYQQQAEQVLAASAALTDHQKMSAELFDDKLRSLGFSALFISEIRGLSLEQFVHLDFVMNVAAFDTAIATWHHKAMFDAVRPFTAIRYLWGSQRVTAWGGPGQGTVSLPGRHWASYLGTADHPEYPSGSASFCSAHAQAARRYLGSDALGWSVPAPRGSSRVEPGFTPAQDIVLGPWMTWTDFERDCGMSRVWSGVHFQAAVEAGHELGRPIGDLAWDFVQRHIAGAVH